jgi:K+-transporting ATPase KdpF subunit
MTLTDSIGLVVCVALLVYLVAALLHADRLS